MMPRFFSTLFVVFCLTIPLNGQTKAPSPTLPLPSGFKWRTVGPGNMSGRIVDLVVDPTHTSTWYVASASGGLFKTVNSGTTWKVVFDKEKTISLGAVALAPSDPKVIWVGTGEPNARNSVSWGNGVYVSRDSGRTWKHAGLEKTFQIGRIAISPHDPETVYVAACGRLWGENPERGLYRTQNGGKSWDLVLKGDDKTGAVEVVLDPTNPQIVYATTWERKRDEFDGNHPAKRWGPGGGIWKSTDGGDSWNRLTEGLPTVAMGRIALTIFPKDPLVLYATIETERIGWAKGDKKEATPPKKKDKPATKPAAKPGEKPAKKPKPPVRRRPRGPGFMGVSGAQTTADGKGIRITVMPGGPAAKGGLLSTDIVTAVNGEVTTSYEAMIGVLRSLKEGDVMTLKVLRGGKPKVVKVTLGRRSGRTGRGFGTFLGGQIENIQTKQGPQGFQTGGVYRTLDGGATWKRVNSLNPRPYYFSSIHVDPVDQNRIYVLGVGYYVSADGGKTFKRAGGHGLHPDFHDLWIDPADPEHLVIGEDAGLAESWDRGKTYRFFENIPCGQYYHVSVDNELPYSLYGGLQDNGSWVCPSRTRFSDGVLVDDCFNIGGGDGFYCAPDPAEPGLVYYQSQLGNIGWRNLVTGASGRVRKPAAPKGKKFIFNWDTPYLLSPHGSDLLYFAGNYVCRSLAKGSRSVLISPLIVRTKRGSATTLAESFRQAGLLYVGTDDGAIWMTRDGGRNWQDLTANVKGLPGPRYVSCLEPSRFKDGRVYLSYDGHRSDDMAVYLFVSEDYGKTWAPLTKGITDGPVHEIVEDPKNPNLLFVGTEFGIHATLDRGKQWFSIKGNLPTVAVRDMAVQTREQELAIATHGRGLWILDISGLEELQAVRRHQPVALLPPTRAIIWVRYPSRSLYGHNWYKAPNPQTGTTLHYWLGKEVKGDVSIYICDHEGTAIRYLKCKGKAGLNRVFWNLRREGNVSNRRSRRTRWGPTVTPGTYGVILKIGKQKWTTTVEVMADPVSSKRGR